MAKPASKTLTEFAAGARPVGGWLSDKPERDEVIEAFRNGVKPNTIRNWLVSERGYASADVPAATSLRSWLVKHA